MSPRLLKIAICIPTVADWTLEIIKGISEFAASRSDWSVFLSPMTDYNLERALRGWRGDGVLTAAMSRDIAVHAAGLPVPVVNVAGSLEDPGLPSVVGDDVLFGKVGAEHLLEQGHRHVACVTTPELHFGRVRVESFLNTVTARGCKVYPCLDATGWADAPWDLKIETILTWLRDLPRPLGVFCINDEHAHLVLEACHHGGITVPEEVAVLGVNNSTTLCLLSNPGLSSVSPDNQRRGRLAAAVLHGYMTRAEEEPEMDEDISRDTSASGFPTWRVPSDGVRRRGSTAAFAVEDPLVKRALELIRRDTPSALAVKEVARRAGASRRTLERHFQEVLGRTVYDEIRRQRIERACALLTETRHSMMEIALESGFQSASDLANAFRRHLGMRPGDYRERFRQV